MSKVSSIFGGDDAADASRAAADTQAAATTKAAKIQADTAEKQIEFQKESRDIARGDLEPFRKTGGADLEGLADLVTDPQAQIDFITNNPFFDALEERSNNTILNRASSGGRVGTGDTAEALQNSLFLIGSDLINQDVTRRQNLASLGANAAAGQGNITQNAASNISSIATNSANARGDLITQGANAQAAGIIGASNAKQGATQQGLKTIADIGTLIALCDIRAKENLIRVGEDIHGNGLYRFNYVDDDEPHINVIAQEVEETMPDAVFEIDGLKHVNMEILYAN